mgnify:CR=1 FL=1
MSKQKLYLVYATVTGSKYLGTYRASSKKEAIEKAQQNSVSLCHQCSRECQDPELSKFTAEIE